MSRYQSTIKNSFLQSCSPEFHELWKHGQKESWAARLPVEVRHDCFGSVSPGFLQDANYLEGCIAVPARVDDDGAPGLCLCVCSRLQHPALACSHGPGAADLSHHTAPDVSPICSMEDLINNDACELRIGEMRLFVSSTIFIKEASNVSYGRCASSTTEVLLDLFNSWVCENAAVKISFLPTNINLAIN